MSTDEQQERGLLHTPREIAQQPATWEVTLAIFEQARARIVAFFESAGVRDKSTERPTVLLAGAGTSDYVGQALVLLLRQQWECEVFACASTELLLNLDEFCLPGRRHLLISFSRSGDSPEGVALMQRAIREQPDVAHLVVTCNAEAAMLRICKGARRGCAIVLADAVNDRSLAMTSSFTNMVVMGQCLAHAWSLESYRSVHAQMVAAGRLLLEVAADAAERLASPALTRVCFVGTGALAGVAKESALKVLEMTAGQVKTVAETLLGLRHGPMAALDQETLFVCFAPGERNKALYARDLLIEVGDKSIASSRVVLGPAMDPAGLAACSEVFVPIDGQVPDLYRPALDVIFGQLLGLYASIARGIRPDLPSPHGVIHRVVQPFQIYPLAR